MKKTTKVIAMVALVMSLMMSMVNAEEIGSAAVTDEAAYSIDEMLLYAYQDEANALKEYEDLMAVFGEVNPFVNIAKAEENHLESVIRLYDYFDLDLPDYEADFYRVPETLEATYAIGVEAEIANIAMYETFLSQELDPVMERVFTSLMEASESHLAAFEAAVEGEVCDGSATGEGTQSGQRGQDNKGNRQDNNKGSRGGRNSRR